MDLNSKYILPDGEILSCRIVYSNENNISAYVIIDLKVRRLKAKNKTESCKIRLRFDDLIDMSLFEDFGTQGNYSDITLVTTDNNEIYLSLDPYDNLNKPDSRDNFVIRSKKIEIQEFE